MCAEGSWRLGPGARRRIVAEVKTGVSQKRAAARFCVSPATANLWVARERDASDAERESATQWKPCNAALSSFLIPEGRGAKDHLFRVANISLRAFRTS